MGHHHHQGHHRRSADNISESYLMDTLPSRRASKQSLGDQDGSHALVLMQSSSPTRASPPGHTHGFMTADEHFRPTHMYRGHEAEVWVGERSLSITREELDKAAESRGSGANGTRLVIGKKKEFKIEVDRASRIV